MVCHADEDRYQTMEYRHCGQSGLKLPIVSPSLWYNSSDTTQIENSRALLQCAFDLGINHFDLANNYGPPPGSAKRNFSRILRGDFLPWQDELIISTKAGYTMWGGPYGDWGSYKYLIANLDQDLKHLGLGYVDIFYHRHPDLETPLKETMRALNHVVRQDKALYIGLSNYPADPAKQAIEIFDDLGAPCLIHQPKYSMLEHWIEGGLLPLLQEKGVGSIAFSPLAGGRLTDRYLDGIPTNSCAASTSRFLNLDQIAPQELEKARVLNALTERRGQKLSQMALAWMLRDDKVIPVLIGTSKTVQIEDAVGMLVNRHFASEECAKIDAILS